MNLPLLPTTLVGSYPQPNWLVDKKVLFGRGPPRVRMREVWRVPEAELRSCPSSLSHPGYQRMHRRRRRCAFHCEGGEVFSGNGVWICLPTIDNALDAAGSARESMAIPVTSSSPHENPQTEPGGCQAASLGLAGLGVMSGRRAA